MLASGDRDALPEAELAEWVQGQRWFGSKARDMAAFRVLGAVPIRPEPPLLGLLLVEARFRAGTHNIYQVLVGVRGASDEEGAIEVIHRSDELELYDALHDPRNATELARLVASGAVVEAPGSIVRFCWREGTAAAPDDDAAVRVMSAEQSNTSVVFDERLVLKAFRRVEPGINPELEMLRFLSAHDFSHIAELVGWYEYSGELMEATLGVMQRFIPAARDGWDLAIEAVAAHDDSFFERLRTLGAVTGQMHTALASDPADPDFAPEDPGDETVPLLTATIDEEIERMFVDLPDRPALEPISGRGEEVRDLLTLMAQAGVGGRLIRNHGDYHLGQTVLSSEGWIILDFEGEPGRPLIERRRRRSPLRDVAGMLRSFAYVASANAILHGRETHPEWERRARELFLDGYLAEVDPTLLPAGPQPIARMLAIFELEKAIYELRYELNNRPDWVSVPVAGIMRLLEESVS
jgi:trehalose synthase-fused probable maltokinase